MHITIQLQITVILVTHLNTFEYNLCRYAKILSQERRLRDMRSPHTKKAYYSGPFDMHDSIRPDRIRPDSIRSDKNLILCSVWYVTV